jgi:hypothetical protein
VNAGDWAAAGAVGAVVIALAALWFSIRSTRAAERSARAADRAADAAEEQTKIQRQLRQDAAQPYVWADIRIDEGQGVLLALVVGNSGPTVATNVKVTIDPPFPHIKELQRAAAAQERLAQGLKSLPPGRTLHFWLGQGFNLLDGAGPKVHRITITADGPFGTVPAVTYDLDLSEFEGQSGIAKGSLHLLTKAVERLGQVAPRSTPGPRGSDFGS